MLYRYNNRTHAGKVLAQALQPLIKPPAIVLALPRGGVPVAFEIAQQFYLPMDVMLVRKLGFPGQEECAMGAIAWGGLKVLDPELARLVPAQTLAAIIERETAELNRREQAYRGHRIFPKLEQQQVILVDDGLATGSTMRAALAAVRQSNPSEVIVAVPVAPLHSLVELQPQVEQMVCPLQPDIFWSVAQWYDDFTQTTDAEVCTLLGQAWSTGPRQR